MVKLSTQEIHDLVDQYREEAIQLFQKTVQIPSPTGQELELSQFFEAYMQSFGLSVSKYEYETGRPNLIAEWTGNEAGKRFIFNGHMDVFPPPKGVTSKYGPWSGVIQDGKLYGQGAGDMKAGDCAAMMAVRILKESGYIPNGKIVLSYMVDEENTSEKGVLSLLKDGLLTNGDFGICMEPSHHKMLMEEGGVWQAEVTYYASGGHTTHPTQEEDALMKSIKAITHLYQLREKILSRSFSQLGHPFFQINMLTAGTVSNIRASKSTFSIDRRFAWEEGIEKVKKEIIDVLDALKAADPAYDYTLREIAYYPCAKRDRNDESVQLMFQACQDITGKQPQSFARYASSDAVHIMDHTGMQMPIYGPGDLDICSTSDECVDLEEYLTTIKIYIRMLDLLLGQRAEENH